VNANTQLLSGDCIKLFDAGMVTNNGCTSFAWIIRSKFCAELAEIIHWNLLSFVEWNLTCLM